MNSKNPAVDKTLFYGIFIGTFSGAVLARLLAGVNTAATGAFLVVTLGFALVSIARVAFRNDERITVIENEGATSIEEVVKLTDAVNRIVELETHDFTITDGQEPDGTPSK